MVLVKSRALPNLPATRLALLMFFKVPLCSFRLEAWAAVPCVSSNLYQSARSAGRMVPPDQYCGVNTWALPDTVTPAALEAVARK